MIICSSSNIDLIQGVSGYGTAADGATDWRIENTATGVFNILNSPNLLAPNVSIIDAGNIGIGTIPVSGTNKLQVQGNLNVSGGYFVAGVAFKPATAVLADTATALATSRNIAGVGFTGAGNIDIPYFNLTNKITAGNGISLTSGSASSSPSISTNLTAGNGISISAAASPTISANLTAGNGISISAAASPVITANITAGANITFTGTNPISISAAGGTASQWTTTGANIYYNSGNVGIGTNDTPYSRLCVTTADNTGCIKLLGGVGNAGEKWWLGFCHGSGSADSNDRVRIGCEIQAGGGGNLYFNTSTAGSIVERMRITSTGNVGIGTATVNNILQVGAGGRLRISNGASDYTLIGTVDADSGNNARILLSAIDRGGGLAGGNIEYLSTASGSHIFSTTSSIIERMRITSTGNVGIGTNNPGFRLEVASFSHTSFNILGYYMNQSAVGAYGGPWSNICAKFNGGVWCTDYFMASSDIRIKEDIQDIIDDTALQSILSIEPKTYKYVDKLIKGDKKVFGFIAQQIKDVIPEAVLIEKSYIPNIYLVADYIDYVISLSSQPTKVIIKVNDKIKCYDKDNKEILVEVIEVIDDLTFRIKEIEYTDTKIFVYGTFVDDFHTLNKDYIFTLNVCATQELHRRIEAQSVLLKSQGDRIKDLEAKVATLMSNM